MKRKEILSGKIETLLIDKIKNQDLKKSQDEKKVRQHNLQPSLPFQLLNSY